MTMNQSEHYQLIDQVISLENDFNGTGGPGGPSGPSACGLSRGISVSSVDSGGLALLGAGDQMGRPNTIALTQAPSHHQLNQIDLIRSDMGDHLHHQVSQQSAMHHHHHNHQHQSHHPQMQSVRMQQQPLPQQLIHQHQQAPLGSCITDCVTDYCSGTTTQISADGTTLITYDKHDHLLGTSGPMHGSLEQDEQEKVNIENIRKELVECDGQQQLVGLYQTPMIATQQQQQYASVRTLNTSPYQTQIHTSAGQQAGGQLQLNHHPHQLLQHQQQSIGLQQQQQQTLTNHMMQQQPATNQYASVRSMTHTTSPNAMLSTTSYAPSLVTYVPATSAQLQQQQQHQHQTLGYASPQNVSWLSQQPQHQAQQVITNLSAPVIQDNVGLGGSGGGGSGGGVWTAAPLSTNVHRTYAQHSQRTSIVRQHQMAAPPVAIRRQPPPAQQQQQQQQQLYQQQQQQLAQQVTTWPSNTSMQQQQQQQHSGGYSSPRRALSQSASPVSVSALVPASAPVQPSAQLISVTAGPTQPVDGINQNGPALVVAPISSGSMTNNCSNGLITTTTTTAAPTTPTVPAPVAPVAVASVCAPPNSTNSISDNNTSIYIDENGTILDPLAVALASQSGARRQLSALDNGPEYLEMRSSGSLAQDWLDKICRQLVEHMNHFGICVIDNFLGSLKAEQILKEVQRLYSSGHYTRGRLVSNSKPASGTAAAGDAQKLSSATAVTTATTTTNQVEATDGPLAAANVVQDSSNTNSISSNSGSSVNSSPGGGGKSGAQDNIRSDRVIWVDGCEEGCSQINNLIQTLCSVITHSSRLSLYSNNGLDKIVINKRTKAHVACYPGNGTRYIKHVDNPNGDGRVITAIYYLNKNWNTKRDGGLLRMFPAGMDEVANIEPLFDRVLFFWSDRRNPHEVLPAYRDRFAITVWYIGENRHIEHP